MSIEIDFYPLKASKTDLKNFIESQGFYKTRYFLNPFPQGTLYYAWYEEKDYKSKDGVEAVIIPFDRDNKDIKKSKDYFLHTRTRVWASAYDRQKQNEIIKDARKRFGGYFYNDHGGKNRYIQIHKDEFLKPEESGILNIYERLKDKLMNLYKTLAPIEEPFKEAINNAKHPDVKSLLINQNPDQYLYNSLLPFAVSVIEHFFKELFIVLIKYNSSAQKILIDTKIREFKMAINVSHMIEIQKGENSIEDLLAANYTFQNIGHINEAYKKFLGIDMISILSKRKIKNKLLKDELVDIIERRHGMIHHFIFSPDMNKMKFIDVLETCNLVIEDVMDYIENEFKFKIREHSINYGLEIFPDLSHWEKLNKEIEG